MPGDNVKMTVELLAESPIAMDEGLRFAIREGGRTVGSGVVTKILQVRCRPAGERSERVSGPARRRLASGTAVSVTMREYVWLECTVCGARNYRTQKETRGADRLELKKFCRKERKHTPHKESRKK